MQQTRKITAEERTEIHQKLANEFVKSKTSKNSWSVWIYLLLQNTFVDKIMFKNKKDDLERLKQSLAAGSVNIPTELETMMNVESREII